jgi:winged helix DNA-binding protein
VSSSNSELAAVALERLRTQRLVGERFPTPLDVVAAMGAVQAQDYAGAKWALGQRTSGFTDAQIDTLFDDGAILRTHVMRPTWHFVAPQDIAWLLRLTAPRVKAILGPYDRRLEIDAGVLKRSHRLFAKALRDGNHLTRADLATRLRAAGIEASGQRLGHLVMHAELDGLIVSGRRVGKQFTYALLAERAPHPRPLTDDESLAEIAMRFFTGHGPAQLTDFAWWSGLTVAAGRRGIEAAGSGLASRVVAGKSYWSSPVGRVPRPGRPVLHLLPNYDDLFIAYRDRDALVDESVHLDAASLINHVVVVNGRVRGGWKRTPSPDGVIVEVGRPISVDGDALRRAALELSLFLEKPVKLAGFD